MKHQLNKKIYITVLSLVAFTFVIVAMVSTFYTSKASEIKKEQIKLIKTNIALKESIQDKKEEFSRLQDKIEEIQESVTSKDGHKNSNIKKLLENFSTNTKKLIVDSIPSGYPLTSNRITSKFGYRMHPIYGEKRFHHGIDFGGKLGSAITATADGIVEFSGFDKGYGNLVVVNHNFGFKTAYGHMLDNLKIKKGDFIKKGAVLGYLGNSGISTGPHLHYEVKYIKNSLNPKNFLTFNLNNFDTLFYAENQIAWDSLISAIMNQYGRIGLAKLL